MKQDTILRGKYSQKVDKMIKLNKKDKSQFISEMERYADNFLKTNFNMKLEIPIEICGRLTRSGGSFHYGELNGVPNPKKIKVSERFMACALLDKSEGLKAILDVLEHELVHYALCVKGEKFSDGDDTFEETLAKLNIGSSGATPERKRLSSRENVWYILYDEYYNKILGKKNLYKHTKSKQEWLGERVGFRVVKVYF